MTNLFAGTLKAIVIALVITLFNCFLLVGAFCLPTGVMRKHVAESTPLVESEEMYLRWNYGYNTTQVDGQSEYDLYGMAINEDAEGSIIEQAMFMWYPDGENLPRNEGVSAYARKDNIHFDQRPYTRYWNGSVIFIKLLLLKFTIQDIRMINFFIQMILLLVIVWIMARQKMDRYMFPFIAGIFIINPFTMALSVKYASEYIPMLLCILIILVFGDKIDGMRDGYSILFAATGAITAFMCMLSFPSITLGMPLLVLLWRGKEKNAVKTVINKSMCWGLAYAVSWSLKWIIGTLTTDYNFIEDAFEQMFKYQDSNEIKASVIDRLKQTVWCIYNPVYILMVLSIIILILIIIRKNIKKQIDWVDSTDQTLSVSNQILSYTIVALIPFIIIIALGNGYAYVHAYMAHRNYAIAVSAGLSVCAIVFEKIYKRFIDHKYASK